VNEQLERDIKTALLSGDKQTVETLKGLKSAIQYEAVSKNLKSQDLDEEQIQTVIIREAKKRQEAAELYKNAGEIERADKELSEKAILSKYLPQQMSEEEISELVDEEVAKLENPSIKDMGSVIGTVKSKTGGAADGSLIARLTKERLG